MRIKIVLDYVGSAYSGWQRQPDMDTVQGRVEDAIFSLTGERTAVTGSGRTDAGVHALFQPAHFDTNATFPLDRFVTGLNHFLPPDIRVKSAEVADARFHAIKDATEKTYEYLMYRADAESAIHYGRAHRILPDTDIERMSAAAKLFVGKKDFAAFCASGSSAKTTVRTVKDAAISERNGFVIFSVTADGFLYNMVRIMVACLLAVGRGKMDEADIEKFIEGKDRTAFCELAPAGGLYLVDVKYGKA